ncbi:MAG: hypothetical protein HY664_08650 [Chloroflexi bacterium]|nr:hypothetical protein [Chloroflexota bacterium]
MFHLVGGSLFPSLAFVLPRNALLTALGVVTASFIVWEVGRFVNPHIGLWSRRHLAPLLKEEEAQRVTGATCLLAASLITFLVYEKAIAMTALYFLSLGDPVAAAAGGTFGKRRVFNKSWEGTLAMLLTCLTVGLLLSSSSLALRPLLAVVGAVSASVVELLPLPWDDNLTIPLISATTMALSAHYW